MGSKGSATTNTTQNQTYAPAGAGYVQNALNQAQSAAQLPFNIPQAPVAGFSQDQLSAFNTVNNAQGMAQPYINQAQNYFQQGTQPNVSQFFNPYAGAVTSNLQDIFGQQMSQATGTATQQAGGTGADRIAVAQSNLAKQQGLAAGQTLSGLYQPSLNAALQQESALQGAGYGTAALGSQAQNAALTGAQAQLGTGGLQQQLQQAQMNAPYQQQLAQAAFPYQQAQFLASITGALAPGLGGTSYGTGTSQSTPAQPSIWSQLLGGGMAGAGLLGQSGAFGSNGWLTGSSPSYGGGNFFSGDAYGGSANNPLPGLSPSDYGSARGGPINPYAEGGPVSDQPIDVSKGFVPQEQLHPIQTQMPQLNLNPPQQGGGQQSGGGFGDILKTGIQLAGMFMERGGSVSGGDMRKFDGYNPYSFFDKRFPQGYAEGGAPEMSEADQAAMSPETFANPFVKQKLGDIASLPQRALDASAEDFSHRGEEGYDPQSVGPAMETAMRMAGSGASFAQRGALGTSGGKPVAPSVFPEGYYDKVPQDMRLSRKGVSHPGIRWEVYDPKTGTVMRKDLQTRSGASLAQDRLDNKYGAYRYQVRPVRAQNLTDEEAAFLKDKDIQFKRGGRAYADGGTPDLEERFAPVRQAIESGDFDPQGMNSTTFEPAPGLPPQITGGQSRGLTSAMSFAPQDDGAPAASSAAGATPQQDNPYQVPIAAQREHNNFAESPWAALTAAGLGIMGGSSPFAGVNIGQGGMQGLKMLETQREQARKDETTDQGWRRLEQEAKAHEDSVKLAHLPYEQMTKAEEARQAQAKEFNEERYTRTTPHEEFEMKKPFQIGRNLYQQPIFGVMDPKTGGWVDPVTKKPVDASQVGEADDTMIESMADQIANYGMPPISPYKATTPVGMGIMRRVMEKNPQYSSQFYHEAQVTRDAFAKGPQADQVRSFSTAFRHLDLTDRLLDAMDNGDIKAINSISNRVKTEFGLSTAPNNFDAAKSIVMDEVIKAVIGARGALGDREDAQAKLDAAKSPAMLRDAINSVYKPAMLSQLQSYKQQYEAGTHGAKDFVNKLSPEVAEALQGEEKAEAARRAARTGQQQAPAGGAPAAGAPVPQKGERKQFKQGWGVWDGSKWVSE